MASHAQASGYLGGIKGQQLIGSVKGVCYIAFVAKLHGAGAVETDVLQECKWVVSRGANLCSQAFSHPNVVGEHPE